MLSLHIQQRPDTRTRAFSTSGEALLVMFRITDPDGGDVVDVWSDGETIAWHGTIDGEPVQGSMARIDFDPRATPICFTPVTAILCLGAAVLLFGSNCAGRNEGPCPGPTVSPTDVPGGGGGVPDECGDGDGDSDGGKGSGGDED